MILIGDDLLYLATLTSELRAVTPSLTIIQASQPLKYALQHDLGNQDALVVLLPAVTNIGDIDSLVARLPDTCFVFLTQEATPRAALAHAIHRSGGEVMSRSTTTLVIIATVIAMLAQRTVVPGGE